MSVDIYFISGFSLIIVHEMDAIRCHEWRVFPGLSLLSDKLGMLIFLFAHIPIFIWIFWQLTVGNFPEAFRVGFDIFLMVHLILHLLFLKHKNNEFKGWVSWTIIVGATVFGAIDLITSQIG